MGLIVNFSDFENISATGLSPTDYVIGYRPGPNREIRSTIEEFFIYLQTLSSNNVYVAVSPNSANWNSTYSTVKSLSDTWEESVYITPLQVASASWDSVYSTVKSLSDTWEESVYITPLQVASASWDSVYSTVNSNSANWNDAYTNLVNNSAAYLLSGTDVNLGDIPTLSGNWNSVYSNVNLNSSYYALTNQNTIFGYNVTINGNLTALGTSTFTNTIFTTTSALSVINNGPGPALYISQAPGNYNIASFYDQDGVEVLHVGNAFAGVSGRVGINESNPGAELTVNGAISSNSSVSAVSMQVFNTVGIGAYAPLYFNLDVTGPAGDGSIGNSYGKLSFGSSSEISINPNTNLLLGPVNNVGIGTTTPSAKLTVNGEISASSSITVLNGNSNQWNSVYSNVGTNSASWDSVYSSVRTNSASWDSVYSNVRTNSASWDSVYSSVRTNSASWDSVYSSVRTNSASWNSVYSNVGTNSASWNSVYSNVNSNSSRLTTFDYLSTSNVVLSAVTITSNLSATGRINTIGIYQNIIPVVAGLSALNLTLTNGSSALVYTPPAGYKFIASDYFITTTVKIGNFGTGTTGGTFNLLDSNYKNLANSVSPGSILNIDEVVKGSLSNTNRTATLTGVWIVMTTAPNLGTGNTITALSATVLVTGNLIPTTTNF